MTQWNCCRLCLSMKSLYPIFQYPDKSNKYSNVLFLATGLKIEMNDNLPQELCTDCVTFINKFLDFRKMCQIKYDSLMRKFISNKNNTNLNNDNDINITYSTNDNVFYESNNEMLDSDTASCHKQVDEKKGFTEHETSVKDLLKKRSVIIFKNVKFKNRIKCNYNREENILEETDNLEVREEGEDKIKESPVECEFCHKLFKTKVSLHNHCKTHTGLNVVCEHCGKKFMNKRRLLMHCKAKHGYEKTDKCSYCDYKGCNAELVKIHERTHTGEKPYVCGVCGCGFHRRSSYLQHVPTHLPHKSVPCDECPAMFKSVTLMRIHKSRHRSRRNDGRKRAEKT